MYIYAADWPTSDKSSLANLVEVPRDFQIPLS